MNILLKATTVKAIRGFRTMTQRNPDACVRCVCRVCVRVACAVRVACGVCVWRVCVRVSCAVRVCDIDSRV